MTQYTPLLAAHPSFIGLCSGPDHDCALAILATATYIADVSFAALIDDAQSLEVSMLEVEIAAGAGKYGPVVARMAGFCQEADGHWYSHGARGSVFLTIAANSLSEFMKETAEYI